MIGIYLELASSLPEVRMTYLVRQSSSPPSSASWRTHSPTTTLPYVVCDTGTSSQCLSDSNIELVRFLDSHEGDGARAVFAGVQLLYKNNFSNDPPSKFVRIRWRPEMRRCPDMRDEEVSGDEEASGHD